MPDLQMRFHNDMLVLSGNLRTSLASFGHEEDGSIEMLDILEEEAVEQALRIQMAAGAQCLCTPTLDITRARLAHGRMRDKQQEVIDVALSLCNAQRPQHVIAEIGPTMLPLDPTSKSTLVANRDQYAEVVEAFGPDSVDAFLFNGLEGAEDVRCALIGARKVCATPVMVSADVSHQGVLMGRTQTIEEIIDVAIELEANVIGIRTDADPTQLEALVRRMASTCDLPILVQVVVTEPTKRYSANPAENPYWHPDTMLELADRLRPAGAQFLRAVGQATPSYTGALVAASMGLPCAR